MSKGKGGGGFRGPESKTGKPVPPPQAARRPAALSVPRIAPRTRASPKGR